MWKSLIYMYQKQLNPMKHIFDFYFFLNLQ